jgi:hypothetical protein
MGGTEAVSAVAIFFAFVMGIPIGVVLVVSFASLVEDRRKSLWGAAPNAACLGARRLVSAIARGGWPFGGFVGQNRNEAAQGQGPER